MSTRTRGKIWMAKDTDTLMTLAHLPNGMIAVQTGHCVETVQRKRSALGMPNYYATRLGTWREIPAASLRAIQLAVKCA